MLRLLLARHAKSSWDNPSLSDHDRPLSPRGQTAAPAIGAALRERGFVPELVYSSTSARTRETWAAMEPELGEPVEIDFQPDLYLASPGTMMALAQSAPSYVRSLMILAHNPGTQALAAGLTAAGNPDDIQAMRMKFPTGAVSVIEFAADRWEDIDDNGTLVDFLRPRLLGP